MLPSYLLQFSKTEEMYVVNEELHVAENIRLQLFTFERWKVLTLVNDQTLTEPHLCQDVKHQIFVRL